MNDQKQYDVIIHGAGIVGLTTAALLAKQKFSVAIVDVKEPITLSDNLSEQAHDLRVSAITHASQQVFQDLNFDDQSAWELMQQKRVSPYDKMTVWEQLDESEINFAAAEVAQPYLGHIIENSVITSSLYEVIKNTENVTCLFGESIALLDIKSKDTQTQAENLATVTLASGETYQTQLVVGADGGNSPVRELANINAEKQDYGQSGLVATVELDKSHQMTAWQRFLPDGPVAFLPLSNGYCSIVWTLPADRVAVYLRMDDDEFNQALEKAVGEFFGKITVQSKRAAFPLKGAQAKEYVKQHIALVGDAAHQIHPLAGQGVNLGIKDAQVLVAQLVQYSKDSQNNLPNKDLGNYLNLRRYARARRGDNVMMMRALEGFSLLFGHSSPAVKTIRQKGLSLMNKLPIAKKEIIKRAMGL